MKKYLLYLFFAFLFGQSIGQNICSEFVDTWYLKQMKIDGVMYYNLPLDEEVVNITLQCPDNVANEFITTYCQTGMGVMQEIGGGDTIFVNGEFTISGEACEQTANLDSEQLYFSFFLNNVSEAFEFIVGVIDFIPPPGPSSITYLEIYAPNGDFVYYEDFPRTLLSSDEFNINSLLVIPNPVIDVLKIQQQNNDLRISEISLYNITGALVETFSLLNSSEVNIAHLQAGVYFVRISTQENQVIIKKIVKG